jgi:hypothetical protein
MPVWIQSRQEFLSANLDTSGLESDVSKLADKKKVVKPLVA